MDVSCVKRRAVMCCHATYMVQGHVGNARLKRYKVMAGGQKVDLQAACDRPYFFTPRSPDLNSSSRFRSCIFG